MANYHVGKIIKQLREQRGMSQEDLAEGIFDKGNLSRIENGQQYPSKEKLDSIMQKLGVNAENYFSIFLNDDDFEMFEKRRLLKAYIAAGDIKKADRLLDELEKHKKFQSGLRQQSVLSSKAAILSKKRMPPDEIREILVAALKISIPFFHEKYIKDYFPTNIEVELINMYALLYAQEDQLNKAISILSDLLCAIEKTRVEAEEKARLYPLVAYNLSKFLGLERRYTEAIKLCEETEGLCHTYAKYELLPMLTFNRAYCLYEVGQKEESQKLMPLTYYSCLLYRKTSDAKIIKDYAKEKFGIVFSDEFSIYHESFHSHSADT